MRPVLPLALLAAVLTASAADKEFPLNRNSDENVEIEATLLLGPDAVRQAIGPDIPGSDLGGNYIGVRVTVRPVTDTPVKIWRDDFTLLCDKNGQRSTPFGPSQIAGSATMVIKMKDGATVGTNMDRTPVWMAGPVMGGSGGGAQPTPTAEVKEETTDKDKKDSPLLVALREKILPEKTVSESTTGLLFFVIDGKLKPKNLELLYKTANGRLGIQFAYK